MKKIIIEFVHSILELMYLLPHIGLIWDCYVLNKFIYYSEVWYLNVIYQLLPVKLSTVPKKEIHLRTNYAILSFMKWFDFCVLACWKEINENRNNENKLGSLFLNLFTQWNNNALSKLIIDNQELYFIKFRRIFIKGSE